MLLPDILSYLCARGSSCCCSGAERIVPVDVLYLSTISKHTRFEQLFLYVHMAFACGLASQISFDLSVNYNSDNAWSTGRNGGFALLSWL